MVVACGSTIGLTDEPAATSPFLGMVCYPATCWDLVTPQRG